MDIKKWHSKTEKNRRHKQLLRSIGGFSRAGALSPEARTKIARYAAQVRWGKKGVRTNYHAAISGKGDSPKFPDRTERAELHARDEQQEAQRKRLIQEQIERGYGK